jgi:RNA polymerase-binding transcription factor DksA
METESGPSDVHAPMVGTDVLTDLSDADLTVDQIDAVLDNVERALGRLDDGTYGRCATCGGPIDDDRLASLPATDVCTECAAGPAD